MLIKFSSSDQNMLANDLVDKLFGLYRLEHPAVANCKVIVIKAIHALVKLGFTGLSTPETEVTKQH